MTAKKYTSSNHALFNLGYHLIIVTKYRHHSLNYFESEIKDLIMIASNKANINTKNIEIMPDHVHIFFKCKSTDLNIPKIVQYLKGFTSYSIRKKHQNLKKYKHFWSPSYFIESIGHISEKTVRKYIDNQKINMLKY